jgi:hypothetical protein
MLVKESMCDDQREAEGRESRHPCGGVGGEFGEIFAEEEKESS